MIIASVSIGGQTQSTSTYLIAYVLEMECERAVRCTDGIRVINPDDPSSFIHVRADSIEPTTVAFTPGGNALTYYSYTSLNVFDLTQMTETYQIPVNEASYEWSPTMDVVALADVDEQFTRNLYILNMAFMEVEQITEGIHVLSHMSWSPDGHQLLFSGHTGDGFGQTDIYLFEMLTGEIRNISNAPGFNHSPAWSADGTKFAHISGSDYRNEITIRDSSDTDTVLQVIDFGDDAQIGYPRWALDDSTLIYFKNEPNSGSVLYAIDISSRIINGLSDGKPIAGHDISSDGRKVVYQTTLPDHNLCTIYLPDLQRQCFPEASPFYWGSPAIQ